MALPDLTGQNIQDTYQRLVQVDATGSFTDGTGSLLLPPSASFAISASHAVSASHEITYELSSSHAQTADSASYVLASNIEQPFTNITASGNISASGDLLVNNILTSGNITASGDLFVTEYIKHKGDDNTAIRFTNNKISFDAGGMTFFAIHDDDSAPYTATINGGSNRINFRALDRNQDVLLKTDSEAFNVGLYYAGSEKLSTQAGGVNITGNITASNHISASGNVYVKGSSTNGVYVNNEHALGTAPTVTEGTVFGGTDWTGIHVGRSTAQTKNIMLHGPVTASGYISASTAVQAATYQMKGSNVIWDLYGTQVFGAADSQTLVLGNGLVIGSGGAVNISLSGPVTASNNISASGYIAAESFRGNGRIYPGYNISTDHFLGKTTTTNPILRAAGGFNVAGHLTASGNISASGEVIFGTPDARHTHTFYGRIRTVGSEVVIGDGHVTASGNISASGDINAGALGTGSFDHIVTSGQTIEFKDGNSRLGTLKMTSAGNATFGDATTGKSKVFMGDVDAKNLYIEHNITASNNITASGGVTANLFALGETGNQNLKIYKSANNAVFKTNINNASILFGGVHESSNTTAATIDFANKSLISEFHITASGNISASSGTITANEIASAGQASIGTAIYIGSNQHRIHQDPNNSLGLNISKPLSVDGSITASSDISASGTIYGNSVSTDNLQAAIGEFTTEVRTDTIRPKTSANTILNITTDVTIDSNITASGDISASGTVYADNFVSAGSNTITFGDNLNIDGHITASGNISGSSDLYGLYHYGQNFFPLPGNSAFGIGTTSTSLQDFSMTIGHHSLPAPLTINSNITASNNIKVEGFLTGSGGTVEVIGDISASGDITGNNLYGIGTINTPRINGTHSSGLYVADHINAQGHITASGNIKGSVITGNSGLFSGRSLSTIRSASGGLFFYQTTGFAELVSTITSQQGDIVFTPNDGNPTSQTYLVVSQSSAGTGNENALIGIGRRARNTSMLHVGGNAEFDTHITASGTIHSEVTVKAPTGSYNVLTGNTSEATGLEVSGFVNATSITASSDISASGIISAQNGVVKDRLYFNGYGGSNTHLVKGNDNNLALANANFSVSAISASGDISASGTVKVGSLQFGTSTIGGTISNEGIITGYETDGSGTAYVLSSHTQGGSLTLKNAGTTRWLLDFNTDSYFNPGTSYGFVIGGTSTDNKFEVVGTTKLGGHVTASGNISASGDVYAAGIELVDNADIVWAGDSNHRILTSGNPNDLEIIVDRHLRLQPDSDIIICEGSTQYAAFDGSQRSFEVEGTITASGDISSSNGTGSFVYGYVDEKLGVNVKSPTRTLQVAGDVGVANYIYHNGDDTTYLRLEDEKVTIASTGESLNVQANITASGDISSSGNIYSNNEQYWSTTGRLVVGNNTTNYYGPNAQGVNYYYWNRDLGTSATTITSKTTTLNSGFKLPYKAVLTGYHLNIQGRTTDDNIEFTLVYCDGMWDGDVTSLSQTLVAAEAGQTITIGSANNFYELDRRDQFAIPVSPMTMLYPRFKKTAATGGTNYDFQLAVQYRIVT